MTQVKFANRASGNYSQVLDELFNNIPSFFGTATGSNPPANIYETNEGYHIELNVPGRNKEDFKVNIDQDLLTVSYEKPEKNVGEYKTIHKEFGFHSFKRSFHLDEKMDNTSIHGKYENGLLKIFLPKKQQVKEEVKDIPIL